VIHTLARFTSKEDHSSYTSGDYQIMNRKTHKRGIVSRPLAGILSLLLSLTLTVPVWAVVFTNPAPITFTTGSANPYPSNITVSGLTGAITDVNVTLHNINMPFPDSLDILLVSPTGRRLILMSDAGGIAGATGVTLTLDDAAAGNIPDGGPLVTGSFRPTDFGTGDTFPGQLPPYPDPAPAGLATLASAFNGAEPNGVWSLYVVDDGTLGGGGNIMSGWSLDITAGGAFEAQNFAPGDFDGDGQTDLSVQRSTDFGWYWRESSTSAIRIIQFGVTGDILVPADYDGDTRTDIGVFRPSSNTWYILQSATNTLRQEVWGQSGDVLVPQDYDGDGKTDVAVWRANPDPSQNYFFWRRSSDGMPASREWGQQGDIPVRGHFEGTAGADFVVFRPAENNWYILNNAGSSSRVVNLGATGDRRVPADYDGDGKTDVAVFRPSAGDWYILRSSTGTLFGIHWGESGDVPVPTDYDADGKADVAVWKPSIGTWYILNSGTPPGGDALRVGNWGRFGDRPVPAIYYVPEQ
jgi:hypothetical protein